MLQNDASRAHFYKLCFAHICVSHSAGGIRVHHPHQNRGPVPPPAFIREEGQSRVHQGVCVSEYQRLVHVLLDLVRVCRVSVLELAFVRVCVLVCAGSLRVLADLRDQEAGDGQEVHYSANVLERPHFPGLPNGARE